MKRSLNKAALAAIAVTCLISFATAQETEDLLDFDLDMEGLFEEAEDVEGSENTSVPAPEQAVSQGTPSILSFYGSFTAEAAYSRKLYDFEGDLNLPGAYISYTFGTALRPSSDLTVKCEINTKFQDNYSLSVSALFFDYVLFNKAYLTVGKTTQNWGNSSIFDTDILDDTGDPHTLMLVTVPMWHGSLEGSINLKALDASNLKNNLYYAAAIEYPLWGFSYKLFARTWPEADSQRTSSCAGNGAAGLEITGDIFGFHTTLYGAAHTGSESWTNFNYAKCVAGIGKYWSEPQKHGFIVEYQMIADKTKDVIFDHKVSFNSTWRHVADSRYSLGLLGQYNITEQNAYFMPAVSISGLPHATVNFAVPVLINGATYSTSGDNISYSIKGTEGTVCVYLTAFVTLTFSY